MNAPAEAPIEPAPKKRKYKARRTRLPAVKPKAPSDLAGITITACATGCNGTACVISRKPYCAHPYKGGLQGTDTNDPACAERASAAKKLMGKKLLVLGKHE